MLDCYFVPQLSDSVPLFQDPTCNAPFSHRRLKCSTYIQSMPSDIQDSLVISQCGMLELCVEISISDLLDLPLTGF